MRFIGRESSKAHVLSALFTVVSLATACSADDGDETASVPASPVQEFLGLPNTRRDPAAAYESVIDSDRLLQEATADCMKAKGFDYTPIDNSRYRGFGDQAPDWGTDGWVTEWGFGITTQRFTPQQVGPDLKGWDHSIDEPDDPNEDYRDGLSGPELVAYEDALYGGQEFTKQLQEHLENSDNPEDGEYVSDEPFEPMGCQGEIAEMSAQSPSVAFRIDFQDELDDLEERLQADPRIVQREAEISACVAERGLDYTGDEDLSLRWGDDLAAIDPILSDGQPVRPDDGVSDEERAQMSEEELAELYSQPYVMPELSDEGKTKLAELQAEEIELALAVKDCGGGFAEGELHAAVRAEYEQEFLDANADELDTYRTDG